MPILHNAQKALRVSKRKATVNRRIKSRMKTALDEVTRQPKTETLAAAYSSVDKAVKRNIIHRNKAARLKSQLSKLLPAA
jgi:small subunit ribosomal protein S20